MTHTPSRRDGATLLEVAFTLPLFLFLLLGLIVGSLGIFRYQELCHVAHEAARYASVHGANYEKEGKGTAATPQDVYDQAIRPRLMTLDPSRLSSSVTWDRSNEPYTITDKYEHPVGNTVTVTLSYQWFPELYLLGPITLRSSSILPMNY